MSVTITDPPDNSTFPYDEGWTATATIDSGDGVDGVLLDYNPASDGIYSSNGPSGTGPVAGIYTWQVPFLLDGTIANGDPLMIHCYDAETFDDGDSHADTASQAGVAPRETKERKQAAGGPSINITAASQSGTTVTVTVELTPKTTGAIFLALLNYTGDIKKATKDVRVHPLLPSPDKKTRKHTFQGVDAGEWTHIYAVAVVQHHAGKPKVKPIKKP